MTNFSVIIVTYNAMKWTERCFSSLRKSSVPVNVIVIDNGSNDGTQEYIKSNFPEVDFIQSEENLGFGRANNLGIEKAYKDGADFFYLMNQDAWIFEDSFEKLLKSYNAHPNKDEIGIISPMHLDGSEKKLDPHFERYLARGIEMHNLISDLYFDQLQNIYEIPFVNAAHWFLPKKTIEIVGGFNPYFFHGAEDYDYVNRIKFHKMKVFVATNSKVIHDARKIDSVHDSARAKELHQISIRMQTETKYLDPNFPFNTKTERKAFITSIAKHALLRNNEERTNTIARRKFFEERFSEIESLRKKIFTEKHVFLNI